MEIRYTTQKLPEYGLYFKHIPFMVNRQMQLVNTVNRYWREEIITNARWASKKTWRSYAERLYDFFAYLEDNDINWQHVDKHITGHYRCYLQTQGPNGKPLHPNTIYDRIRCVDAFYKWALTQKLIAELPFSYRNTRQQRGFLFQANRKTFDTLQNRALPKRQQRIDRIPTREEIATWLRYLPTKRDQLIAWLIIESGLRREEAIYLNCAVLPQPDSTQGHHHETITLALDPKITPTKGSKYRTVEITRNLFLKLHQYRYSEQRLTYCKRYYEQYNIEPTVLFLSRNAEPLSLSRLDKACQKASTNSGINIHPHLLRKTFATHTLLFRKQALGGDTATRLWLMARMGHTSFETTQLYVELGQDLARREIAVMDEYQCYLANLMEDSIDGCN